MWKEPAIMQQFQVLPNHIIHGSLFHSYKGFSWDVLVSRSSWGWAGVAYTIGMNAVFSTGRALVLGMVIILRKEESPPKSENWIHWIGQTRFVVVSSAPNCPIISLLRINIAEEGLDPQCSPTPIRFGEMQIFHHFRRGCQKTRNSLLCVVDVRPMLNYGVLYAIPVFLKL